MNLTTCIDAQAEVNGGPNGALQGKLNLDIAPAPCKWWRTAAPCASPSGRQAARPNRRTRRNRTAQARFGADRAVGGRRSGTRSLRRRSRGRQNRRRHHRSEPDLAVRAASAGGHRPVAGGCQRDRHDSPNWRCAARSAWKTPARRFQRPASNWRICSSPPPAAVRGLQLSGSLRSKPGQLQLSRSRPAETATTIEHQGQDFRAFDTSDIRIRLSPDLKLEVTRELVRVDGQVIIPQAYLNPAAWAATAQVQSRLPKT